jgi:hypothetical protein
LWVGRLGTKVSYFELALHPNLVCQVSGLT